jgi:hypothetical protein
MPSPSHESHYSTVTQARVRTLILRGHGDTQGQDRARYSYVEREPRPDTSPEHILFHPSSRAGNIDRCTTGQVMRAPVSVDDVGAAGTAPNRRSYRVPSR